MVCLPLHSVAIDSVSTVFNRSMENRKFVAYFRALRVCVWHNFGMWNLAKKKMLRKAKGVKTELSEVASFPPAVECWRDDDEPSGYLSLSLFLSLSLSAHTHTHSGTNTCSTLAANRFQFPAFFTCLLPPAPLAVRFGLSTLPLSLSLSLLPCFSLQPFRFFKTTTNRVLNFRRNGWK